MIELSVDATPFASTTNLVLALLKPLEGEVPGLKVRSLLESEFTLPYVLVRAVSGAWGSDSFHGSDRRFLQRAVVDVQTFTDGINADTAGDALSELCYQVLFAAKQKGTLVPGVGYLNFIRTSTAARRVSDWATSTGVQQYANLNKGYTRYQATYGIVHRPDFSAPVTATDLVALASL